MQARRLEGRERWEGDGIEGPQDRNRIFAGGREWRNAGRVLARDRRRREIGTALAGDTRGEDTGGVRSRSTVGCGRKNQRQDARIRSQNPPHLPSFG